MIAVRLYEDYDVDIYGNPKRSGKKILWVDYGVDLDWLTTVCLPCVRWEVFKQHCYYDSGIGEWILK